LPVDRSTVVGNQNWLIKISFLPSSFEVLYVLTALCIPWLKHCKFIV